MNSLGFKVWPFPLFTQLRLYFEYIILDPLPTLDDQAGFECRCVRVHGAVLPLTSKAMLIVINLLLYFKTIDSILGMQNRGWPILLNFLGVV